MVHFFFPFWYVTLFRHECHVSHFSWNFFSSLCTQWVNNETLRSQVAHKTASKDNEIADERKTVSHNQLKRIQIELVGMNMKSDRHCHCVAHITSQKIKMNKIFVYMCNKFVILTIKCTLSVLSKVFFLSFIAFAPQPLSIQILAIMKNMCVSFFKNNSFVNNYFIDYTASGNFFSSFSFRFIWVLNNFFSSF